MAITPPLVIKDSYFRVMNNDMLFHVGIQINTKQGGITTFTQYIVSYTDLLFEFFKAEYN